MRSHLEAPSRPVSSDGDSDRVSTWNSDPFAAGWPCSWGSICELGIKITRQGEAVTGMSEVG